MKKKMQRKTRKTNTTLHLPIRNLMRNKTLKDLMVSYTLSAVTQTRKQTHSFQEPSCMPTSKLKEQSLGKEKENSSSLKALILRLLS